MSFLLQLLFSFFISFIDLKLYKYFISNKLHLTASTHSLFMFATLLIWNSLKSFTPISIYVGFLLTLLFMVVLCLVCCNNSLFECFFWNSVYMVIAVIADAFTFIVGEIITNNTPQEFFAASLTNRILSFVYLIFCFIGVFIVLHKPSKAFQLPWYVSIIFSILLLLGIIVIELLLGLEMQLSIYQILQKKIIYFSIIVIIISFSTILLVFYYLGVLYQKNTELQRMKELENYDQKQYDLLLHTNDTIHVLKHDLHHHISILQILSKEKKYDELDNYLTSLSDEFHKNIWHFKTGNDYINALLSSKASIMSEKNIVFTDNIYLTDQQPLKDFDFVSIIGNLLDNAIEACNILSPDTEKYIKLDIKPLQNNLYICVQNSSSGIYGFNKYDKLISLKQKKYHGIGLQHVEHLVQKYSGFMIITPEKNTFIVKLSIPFK